MRGNRWKCRHKCGSIVRTLFKIPMPEWLALTWLQLQFQLPANANLERLQMRVQVVEFLTPTRVPSWELEQQCCSQDSHPALIWDVSVACSSLVHVPQRWPPAKTFKTPSSALVLHDHMLLNSLTPFMHSYQGTITIIIITIFYFCASRTDLSTLNLPNNLMMHLLPSYPFYR